MIGEAILCMALNVYHESRGDTQLGQEAVAHVTLNRARNNQTGVCFEVFRWKQFSWTMYRSKMQKLPPPGKDWDASLAVARKIMGGAKDFTGGATHFHVDTLRPCWVVNMRRLGQWGDHIFYKRKPGARSTACKHKWEGV